MSAERSGLTRIKNGLTNANDANERELGKAKIWEFLRIILPNFNPLFSTKSFKLYFFYSR